MYFELVPCFNHNLFIEAGIQFSLGSKTWEVGYSPIKFILYNDLDNLGHKKKNLFGDDFVDVIFNTDIGLFLVSELFRQI